MIKLVYLNWKFNEPGYLYSTEILEESRVIDLIGRLEKLQSDYNLTTVHPISQIFDVCQKIGLPEITKFLKNALVTCQIDSESDLEAYQRLLGPELRHGPEIFQEISNIVDSLLTEGGKYDPVYLIQDFLKDPYGGCSEICKRAIEEAVKALAGNQKPSQEFYRVWTVGDFLEVAGISTDGVDPKILEQKIHILQDDGMGYGAVNGPCTAIERVIDNKTGETQVRVWM